MIHVCGLCEYEEDFPKRRVKCPKCRKMGMYLKTSSEKLTTTESKTNVKLGSRNPHFTGNKFVDDGKSFEADKEFTRKVKFNVSERGTRSKSLVKRKCQRCNSEFDAFAQLDYICHKCIIGR